MSDSEDKREGDGTDEAGGNRGADTDAPAPGGGLYTSIMGGVMDYLGGQSGSRELKRAVDQVAPDADDEDVKTSVAEGARLGMDLAERRRQRRGAVREASKQEQAATSIEIGEPGTGEDDGDDDADEQTDDTPAEAAALADTVDPIEAPGEDDDGLDVVDENESEDEGDGEQGEPPEYVDLQDALADLEDESRGEDEDVDRDRPQFEGQTIGHQVPAKGDVETETAADKIEENGGDGDDAQ